MEKARFDAHRRETWGTFAAQFRWGKVSPVHGRHVVSDMAMLRQFTREAALPAAVPRGILVAAKEQSQVGNVSAGFYFRRGIYTCKFRKAKTYEGVTLPFSASPPSSRLATWGGLDRSRFLPQE